MNYAEDVIQYRRKYNSNPINKARVAKHREKFAEMQVETQNEDIWYDTEIYHILKESFQLRNELDRFEEGIK